MAKEPISPIKRASHSYSRHILIENNCHHYTGFTYVPFLVPRIDPPENVGGKSMVFEIVPVCDPNWRNLQHDWSQLCLDFRFNLLYLFSKKCSGYGDRFSGSG